MWRRGQVSARDQFSIPQQVEIYGVSPPDDVGSNRSANAPQRLFDNLMQCGARFWEAKLALNFNGGLRTVLIGL
ncbi:hypothetical protein GCM10007880_57380 [Mesorhizobium amorphae]|nr:hypothetical protein GCM10007880_57380 [Mesorhizobium amorphae]